MNRTFRNFLTILAVITILFGMAITAGCSETNTMPDNYIGYFDSNSQESKILDTIRFDTEVGIYPFRIKDDCKEIKIVQRLYKYGKLVDKTLLLSAGTEDMEYSKEGIISICPYITQDKKLELYASIKVNNSQAQSCDELTDIDLKKEGDLFDYDAIYEIKEIHKSKELEIFAMDFAGDKGRSENGTIGMRIKNPKKMKDTKWCYVFSMTYE